MTAPEIPEATPLGERGRTGLGVVQAVAALRQEIGHLRREGHRIGLVPTMGALHAGHIALVRHALEAADRVCVSVFVNPTQFGPNEDFAVYPRDEAGDAAKLAGAGAHLLFAPSADEMYPEGEVCRVTVPGLGDILEGAFRPGFFTGVATVVAKLLIQASPDIAVFGEKDYQQLQVIRRMVRDLHIPVRIEAAPTIRESDGLALSSRNAYLTADERAIAPELYATLMEVAHRARHDRATANVERWASDRLIEAGFTSVDYVTVRDAETLEPWPGGTRPGRVLGAAWLGRTRLIDNVPVP
ncbi:MAG: pantoate--beta-alanine ligase [Rhodospirillales bacterium]|nr:MAG: pantoate--beta-alanine ligase [Rhodospirillales bacterium]